MSGSAICLAQKAKITAASRNMHMTGKENAVAAKLRQVVPAVFWAVFGEANVVVTAVYLQSWFGC